MNEQELIKAIKLEKRTFKAKDQPKGLGDYDMWKAGYNAAVDEQQRKINEHFSSSK